MRIIFSGSAEDREKAFELFTETDLDGSGELDAEELEVLMNKIGIHMDKELIEEAINAVDLDGGGTMGLNVPTTLAALRYRCQCPLV